MLARYRRSLAAGKLESSLISLRVRAGMEAAKENGRHVGQPATPDAVKDEIWGLATETDLSIRKIEAELGSGPLSTEVGRGVAVDL